MRYIVEILRYNNEGLGIAKIGDITVFVEGALIGEKVEIEVTEKKKNYYIAKTIEVINKSDDRRVPSCPYYNLCGGCNIMHMSYMHQLEFKKCVVKDIFKKILNKQIDVVIESIDNINYRNKVSLKVEKNKLGFYSNKTHDIVDITKCDIADKKINEIILKLKEFIINNYNHDIKEVIIRDGITSLLLIDNIDINLKDKFIKSLSKCVDTIYINKVIEYGNIQNMQLLDYKFNVSPYSFFQVNTKMVEKLYSYVLDNIVENTNALDLYCGVGTITSVLSKKCKSVLGIEVVKDAINNAKENIELNNIKNVNFICGKVEDNIEKIKFNNIDLVVLDPPRSGSDKKILKTLKEINPKQIIYISCNPVTLARDLNSLLDMYEIKNIKLFDMFPNTYHIESLMVLERK